MDSKIFLYCQYKIENKNNFIEYQSQSIKLDDVTIIVANINSKSVLSGFLEVFFEECNNGIFKNIFLPSAPIPFIIITHEDNINIIKGSILDNSNIWIRTLFVDNSTNLSKKLQEVTTDFKTFRDLKLYSQEAAQEYIDYNLRIQKENCLRGSHKAIAPNRYSSEVKKKDEKERSVKDIGIRLLLIDDKIPCIEKGNKELKNCEPEQTGDCNYCKLRIVKDLLSKGGDLLKFKPIGDTKNIKAYTIGDIKDTNGQSDKKQNEENIKKITKDHNNDITQIIGVNSIDFAKIIMANKSLKFDLILLDYYFHIGTNEFYGNKLLEFIEPATTEESESEKQLRKDVRSNAGLENRFWIFPITAFAPSFLTHLQCDGISLLTNKWYIYSPTNPIVTPVHFLRNLNEFIGMMVDKSVFTKDVLLSFFEKSYIKEDDISFEDYILFMGAEYQRFIQLFGSRSTIARDKKVSLFSKSVNDQFYTQKKNSKIITLNNHLRKFYYASAFLVEERESWEQLRKTWDILSCYLTKHFSQEIIHKRIDIKLFNAKLSKLIQTMIKDQHNGNIPME